MSFNKIDVKKLKKQLSIQDHKKIMASLEIPIFSENKSEIIYFSGDKNKNALEGSPKLYFYKDTHIYSGYTSGRNYDIISLVQTRLGLLNRPCSFIDSIQYILLITGLEESEIQRINNEKYKYNWEDDLGKFIRFRNLGGQVIEYDSSVLRGLSKIYPEEWLDEGISIETMEQYGIGYYLGQNSTTIPCFTEEGKLCGIRVREWNPEKIESYGKYHPLTLLDGTCYKFNTNNVFYNINWAKPYIELTGTVTLVEGEKSCMKAYEFFGEKSNVLGLYGSTLGSRRRNQLLKMGVHTVNIAIDSDFKKLDNEYKKFLEKVENMAKLFKGYCKVYCIYNNIGLDAYKCSPFDFDKETYMRMYEEREEVI